MSGDVTLRYDSHLLGAVEDEIARFERERLVDRLWHRDPSLWTSSGEEKWLGWLTVGETTLGMARDLTAFAHGVRDDGFTDVLLLGMGGSSLGPEVLSQVYGCQAGFPALHVLDSTDPEQIRRFEAAVDLAHTLVVVASKSGSTLEPNILLAHFRERLRQTAGVQRPERHLVAITDPGSKLEAEARRDGFRAVFLGEPSVGGRFSALSVFGMVPAALMGLELPRLLGNAAAMAGRCRMHGADNPGLVLGAALGVPGKRVGASGDLPRDKVTFLLPPEIAALGTWFEQLIAESTGKRGVALIPVDDEPLGAPGVYGDDRVFVAYHVGARDRRLASAAASLAGAGQPVVEIVMEGPEALAAEFLRWEIATAVAGSILGINPFDQPDVEAAKVASRAITEEYEKSGRLPSQPELFRDGDLVLRTDARNAQALRSALGEEPPSLVGLLRAHLRRLGPGDYLGLLAFLDQRPAHHAPLQALRTTVRDRTHAATCLGFGPRFLHSTGQAHKGGPPSGVFLQVSYEPREDVPVPDSKLTFGTVIQAQAGGDLAVLLERGRRALEVHLRGDTEAGLRRLADAVAAALAG